MTKEDILTILMGNLDLLQVSNERRAFLGHCIDSAIAFIEREGVSFSNPYSIEDGTLIVMYASYLFNKRKTDEGMPRMLRWALNNRLFSQKMQTPSVEDDT